MSAARAASGISRVCRSLQTSDCTGAQHAAGDAACLRLRRIGDGESELLRGLLVEAARPGRGSRGARARFDQRHHGAGISAHRGREPAGLDQDFAALTDAHHGAVDAGKHLQHARQAADVFFLPAPFGEIALAAAIIRSPRRSRPATPACCAPASDSCHCDAASAPAGWWRCAAADPSVCMAKSSAARSSGWTYCEACLPSMSSGA